MERVTGIGGFFFVAKNPNGLAAWYRDNLGIDPLSGDYNVTGWVQEPGETAFAPFEHIADPVTGSARPFSLNFRVHDLDAMVAQLRAAGIDVHPDPDSPYPNGRFAWLTDPEGNPIELWEPAQAI